MPKKKRSKEELKRSMGLGDSEEDMYTEAGREELIDEEDEITDVEEGFMEGYSAGERTFQCASCKKILNESLVEEEFDGKRYRFCSDKCVAKFEERRSNS